MQDILSYCFRNRRSSVMHYHLTANSRDSMRTKAKMRNLTRTIIGSTKSEKMAQREKGGTEGDLENRSNDGTT